MARSTVFRYKGKQQDPQQIGNNLKVDAVLTGTMDQQQDHLVINAELVKVADGSQIWGQQFSRNLSDLVAVQSEISSQIADQLKVRLTGEQKKQLAKPATENSEAYRLYLQGRYQWNKRSKEGFLKAIEYFNQAIEKDPTYALAYSGLAEVYGTDSSPFSTDVKIARGKAAALKALELNPNLAEAENSLGAAYWTEWNWDATQKAMKRAIELNPNYPTAHQWYGEFLAQCGKFEQARNELKRARELDPLSIVIISSSGLLEFLARNYAKAEEWQRRALDMDPNFPIAREGFMQSLEQQHKIEELFRYIENANPDEQTRKDVAEARQAYKEGGEKAALQLKLKFVLARDTDPFDIAVAYAQVNENDKAIDYLQKAFASRDSQVQIINVDPRFDNVRNDPRFQEMVRKLNLPK